MNRYIAALWVSSLLLTIGLTAEFTAKRIAETNRSNVNQTFDRLKKSQDWDEATNLQKLRHELEVRVVLAAQFGPVHEAQNLATIFGSGTALWALMRLAMNRATTRKAPAPIAQ